MRKVVEYIEGESPLIRALTENKQNNYNAINANTHNPWEIVYIAICNAHDFYPEHECGRYKTLEEAKKNSELKKYGGRIESTTYGELSDIYF